MPRIISETDILNAALARIGAGTVTGPDEDTDLARLSYSVYHDIVESALTIWLWKWPLVTRALDRLADAPLNGWRHSFQMPGDAIGGPVSLLSDPRSPDHPLREFSVEAGLVHCNCEALWARIRTRPEPTWWPPLFRAAVTDWIAARLAVPVTHDSGLADALELRAVGTAAENMRGGMMGRAIAAEASQSGAVAPLLSADPLTGARAMAAPARPDWY